MVIEWTCVIDDGSRPFAPGIEREQRRPLRLVVSEDTTIIVSIVNPHGAPVELGPGEFLVLNTRNTLPPTVEIMTKRSANGSQKLTITGSNTADLQPQAGEFDLWAIRTSGRFCLIPTSEFDLVASALGDNFT